MMPRDDGIKWWILLVIAVPCWLALVWSASRANEPEEKTPEYNVFEEAERKLDEASKEAQQNTDDITDLETELQTTKQTLENVEQDAQDNAGALLLMAKRVELLETHVQNLWYVTPAVAPTPGYPDDGKDDTAALQWCFDGTKHHKAVYLMGYYDINDTLVTRPQFGLKVVGGGMLTNLNSSSASLPRGGPPH